jgi:UDP-glucose 4-epimerase
MKQILVTGGAGFVGRNLIERLIIQGNKVVSIDNYITGSESNHIEGCTYVTADIREIKNHIDIGKYDVVYHLAALARIQPSFNNPVETFEVNATAVSYICDYCKRYDIPLVYAGSSSHWSGKYKNPYTFSKDIGEDIVEMYRKVYGLRATTTRFYNVYGPYHIKQGDYCTVIGKWEHQYDNNIPLTIYGDGTKKRDFTHIFDIVEALTLIHTKNAWGYTFELGRGDTKQLQEVADMFKHAIIYEENKQGEAEVSHCTDRLAYDVLGWQPIMNIEDYIKSYINNI